MGSGVGWEAVDFFLLAFLGERVSPSGEVLASDDGDFFDFECGGTADVSEACVDSLGGSGSDERLGKGCPSSGNSIMGGGMSGVSML